MMNGKSVLMYVVKIAEPWDKRLGYPLLRWRKQSRCGSEKLAATTE